MGKSEKVCSGLNLLTHVTLLREKISMSALPTELENDDAVIFIPDLNSPE